MTTILLFVLLMLLFIGDIVALVKGIDEWKKKIEIKQGLKRNLWMVTFYIITSALILMLIFVYTMNLY